MFEATNVVYRVGSTNQFYMFTSEVDAGGISYRCRFAVRDPDAFSKAGVLATSDQGVVLWLGDDGTVVVAPNKTLLWRP